MSFFGDILDDADSRMDFDFEDPWKNDDLKTASIKCKSAPGKGMVSFHKIFKLDL